VGGGGVVKYLIMGSLEKIKFKKGGFLWKVKFYYAQC